MTRGVVHRVKIEAGGALILDDSPGLLFPWWSFTKTVLAACALQLVAQDRMGLDEALPGRPYSLHQLLQHTAGVPSYSRLDSYSKAVERGEEPWLLDDMLERAGADQLDFAPGKGWAYSNVGYLFVRQLIERALGTDIGAAMQRLVFGPLGLHSVTLAREPGDLDATAWGDPNRYHPGWVYHGLLIGTASDAVRLLDGTMSGRLLPPDLLDRMKSGLSLGDGLPGRPWETTAYGLGLMIGEMSQAGLAIGHSGRGPESVNAVYHFPECRPPFTAAAFTRGTDEGVTEHALARLAAQ